MKCNVCEAYRYGITFGILIGFILGSAVGMAYIVVFG